MSINVVVVYIIVALLALCCEYIDSALGGGYGTILVPVLLIIGGYVASIDVTLIVPAVLFSELFTGFFAALLHNIVGNANFIEKKSDQEIAEDIKKNGNKKKFISKFKMTRDMRIALILGICGIAGGMFSAFVALNVNKLIVKTYIGILVVLVGIFVLLKMKWRFAWWKIWGLGLIAAFNKGISGGGYGPLVSSGQIVVERNPREAVASTSFSEAVVCVSSLIIYFAFGGAQIANWWLILALLIGAMGSVPLAVMTVKKIDIDKLQPLIGIATIFLGVFTLIKTWFL